MTLNIITDFSDGLNKVFEIIGNIANFIWDIILKITDIITLIITSCDDIFNWIVNYFYYLPSEITSLFTFSIVIIIGVLLYKFLR